MNYKRHRPKDQRASCSLCKPQKTGWVSKAERSKPSDRRRLEAAKAA